MCLVHIDLFLFRGIDHEFWAHVLVKVCFANDLELHSALLERDALLMCVLCCLACGVVTYIC
jgi:hypothetical protein